MVHANNSAGGLLIAWKHTYKLISSWGTRHTCSALLQQINTGALILISNVYGPAIDDLKPAFVEELRGIASLVQSPWILGGDFNLVRWLIDISGNQRSFRLMALFNDLIRDLQLVDVPLTNRRYTWCNNRPDPTHSKLDRILITLDISLQFALISLKALEVLASDHAPLVLSFANEQTTKRSFKMELFWLTNPSATEIIQSTWNDVSQAHDYQGVQRFKFYCDLIHKRLRR